MVHDLVFAIDGIDARLSKPVSLRDVGPLTADSYTEWITQHPQLLGSRVRIVATDLRWQSDRGGEEIAIDVLAIGADGRLIVGVVVVDGDPPQVLLRALTQAAYASRLAPPTLADMHARYLRAHGQPSDEDTALQRLTAHTGAALRHDLLARPRMVIFAEQMSPALGTTVVWLDEMGLDITLQRLRAHETAGQALLIVSRVFPSEPATEFEVVRPRRLQAVTPPDDTDPNLIVGRPEDMDPVPQDPATPPRPPADPDIVFTNGFGHGRPSP
jgi:hypothetical protein